MPEFNQGTLPYELIIRSNTIINNLGSFDLKKVINAVQPKLIKLSEIPDHLNSCVRKLFYYYIIIVILLLIIIII